MVDLGWLLWHNQGMKKLCIVCGKPIPKRTHGYYFRKPQPAHTGLEGPIRIAPRDARPEGYVERGTFISTIYTDHRPETRVACARYTNEQIVHHTMSDGAIYSFSTWDGKSYRDPWFHSDTCAVQQGRASAEHGHRYVWEKS